MIALSVSLGLGSNCMLISFRRIKYYVIFEGVEGRFGF